MDFEDIVLSEISQTKKDNYIWNLKKRETTETSTQIKKNILVAAKSGRRGVRKVSEEDQKAQFPIIR